MIDLTILCGDLAKTYLMQQLANNCDDYVLYIYTYIYTYFIFRDYWEWSPSFTFVSDTG